MSENFMFSIFLGKAQEAIPVDSSKDFFVVNGTSLCSLETSFSLAHCLFLLGEPAQDTEQPISNACLEISCETVWLEILGDNTFNKVPSLSVVGSVSPVSVANTPENIIAIIGMLSEWTQHAVSLNKVQKVEE